MDDLSVARGLPQMRCHELRADRKGQFAVALEHPFRLVLEPADEPPAWKDDGGFDWNRIRKIRVLEVVDYHG
jgi:proteic killer suppression protein